MYMLYSSGWLIIASLIILSNTEHFSDSQISVFYVIVDNIIKKID